MVNFIEPYNSKWKTEFDDLKSVLLKTLDEFKVDIQHVGSTVIPNLYAKPILDIDIIIDNKSFLKNITARLENIGYISKGEQSIKGRFAFRQNSELTPLTSYKRKWQEHHLYVCYSDSLALKNHLLFRDALLGDKNLVKKYSMLKLSLTKEIGMTREEYTKRKTDFIISVLTTLELDNNEINEIKIANV